MDPHPHPAIPGQSGLGRDRRQDRAQDIIGLAQGREQPLPSHALHQPADASGHRLPEAGMAAEIGELAAGDAAEAKAPVLRIEQEMARAPELGREGLLKPVELARDVEPAQRRREGLREGRGHAIVVVIVDRHLVIEHRQHQRARRIDQAAAPAMGDRDDIRDRRDGPETGEALHQEGPDARLVVMGKGRAGQDPVRRRQRLADGPGLHQGQLHIGLADVEDRDRHKREPGSATRHRGNPSLGRSISPDIASVPSKPPRRPVRRLTPARYPIESRLDGKGKLQ